MNLYFNQNNRLVFNPSNKVMTGSGITPAETLLTGLIGYWDFNEITGTTFTNKIGSGHDGIGTGTYNKAYGQLGNGVMISQGNILNNGAFSSSDNWTVETGWTITGGVATFQDTNNETSLIQYAADMRSPFKDLTQYRIEFDIAITGEFAHITIMSADANNTLVALNYYNNGHHSVTFTTPTFFDNHGIRFIGYTSSDSSFSIDNITINEISSRVEMSSPSTMGFTNDKCTFSFWIKLNVLPADVPTDYTFLDLRNSGGRTFWGFISWNVNSIYFGYKNAAGTYYYLESNNNIFTQTGAWYHVVIVLRGVGTKAKVYVNGTEITYGTLPDDFVGTLASYDTSFCFGNDLNYTAAVDGVLDELGVWDRALSTYEIMELYNVGSGKAYPFNNELSFYDNFESYTSGQNLAGQGSWVACQYNMSVANVSSNNKIKSDDLNHTTCNKINLSTFSPNHRVKATIGTRVADSYIGVAARCNGTTVANAAFYALHTDDNYLYLDKNVDGVNTTIAEYGGVLFNDGDTMELVVCGSSLKCYRNDQIITEMGNAQNGATGTAGEYIDTTIDTGVPGIAGYNNGNSYIDNFIASEVGLTISDNFEAYSTGNLAGQGNWVSCVGSFAIQDISGDNRVYCTGTGEQAIKRSEIFDSNQYAEAKMDYVQWAVWLGVGVRIQGSGATGAWYGYYVAPSTRYVVRISGGVWVEDLGSATGVINNNGDILRIEANGTTIKCYRNGSLDTELTGGTGIFTNTGLQTGGSPGITSYNGNNNLHLDDWVGGNL
jgi:hypothetical protein